MIDDRLLFYFAQKLVQIEYYGLQTVQWIHWDDRFSFKPGNLVCQL